MPRKTLDAIVDPVRRIPVDEKRGTVADRLRKVIRNAVAPCDVAFGGRFCVRKAVGGGMTVAFVELVPIRPLRWTSENRSNAA